MESVVFVEVDVDADSAANESLWVEAMIDSDIAQLRAGASLTVPPIAALVAHAPLHIGSRVTITIVHFLSL